MDEKAALRLALSKCPLCDSHVTVTGDAVKATSDYDCGKCGKYTFYDYLLEQISEEQYWPQTRKRLALALQRGVVSKRAFETELDISKAGEEWNKALEEDKKKQR
jgi:transposase-like protein